MNKKFLLCILSSSNEKLLKLSYLSALNQTHHNIDYNIIIIVNSINPTYFNSVKKDDQDAWDDYYYIKADGYYISMVH